MIMEFLEQTEKQKREPNSFSETNASPLPTAVNRANRTKSTRARQYAPTQHQHSERLNAVTGPPRTSEIISNLSVSK